MSTKYSDKTSEFAPSLDSICIESENPPLAFGHRMRITPASVVRFKVDLPR